MKILAIETSAISCSLALLNEDQFLTSHSIVPMQQAKTILISINELMLSAHIKMQELTAIAFGCGPGSFTGIRIATSVAQGLGYAMGIPLIPISSLAALAQSVCDDLGWKQLLVAIDARMNELFWAIYAMDENGLVKLQNNESLCLPHKVDLPSAGDWYGIGTAWGLYQKDLIEHLGFLPIKIDATSLPTARGVARLALEKYQKGEWVNALNAQPVYLRDKVVFSSS